MLDRTNKSNLKNIIYITISITYKTINLYSYLLFNKYIIILSS